LAEILHKKGQPIVILKRVTDHCN